MIRNGIISLLFLYSVPDFQTITRSFVLELGWLSFKNQLSLITKLSLMIDWKKITPNVKWLLNWSVVSTDILIPHDLGNHKCHRSVAVFQTWVILMKVPQSSVINSHILIISPSKGRLGGAKGCDVWNRGGLGSTTGLVHHFHIKIFICLFSKQDVYRGER